MILEYLASGVSQRRAARLARVHRKTIDRRLRLFGPIMREKLLFETALKGPVTTLQFDELETFEHSKCKPISVFLAVEGKTRRILSFQVARMPAKGLLVKKAKIYGKRADERAKIRKVFFDELRWAVNPSTLIISDSNPSYGKDVKDFFPKNTYQRIQGQRGALTGQGELKKIGHDPIFSLNHTCAMLRENIRRLVRKTWCTTKLKDRLADHLAIYAVYHNANLTPV